MKKYITVVAALLCFIAQSYAAVTYKEDKPGVVAKIQSLKDDGTYPDELFKE